MRTCTVYTNHVRVRTVLLKKYLETRDFLEKGKKEGEEKKRRGKRLSLSKEKERR